MIVLMINDDYPYCSSLGSILTFCSIREPFPTGSPTTVNHADGRWMGVGWAMDGQQMSYRRATDGHWMDYRWALDGRWIAYRPAMDMLQTGYRRAMDGLKMG